MPAPDLAGFVASRSVLFEKFGVDVEFRIPHAAVYDLSTPVDDRGVSLDPFQAPQSGGPGEYTTVTVRATVVTRPFGGRGQVRDQTVESAVGRLPVQQIGIIIRAPDYAAVGPPSGNQATSVAFWDQEYEIREWRADGVGGLQRWIVYLTQIGAVHHAQPPTQGVE